MADNDIKTRQYAILIGLNCYPKQSEWKQLKGCVRDVQSISSLLTRLLPTISVHVLTSTPRDGDHSSSQLEEDEGHCATWDTVDACFKKVTSEAKPGDSVYIHYSGHGTLIPPSKAFSNHTTGDLALVLLQGGQGTDSFQIRYLYGEELNEYLQAMVKNGLIVTLVLDCCFSGSTLRDDDTVRYLEFQQEVFDAFPPTISQSDAVVNRLLPGNAGGTTVRRSLREASMLPNWLLDPRGYAILTACGPTEKAREASFDGKKHSVLSFYLLDAFDVLGPRVAGIGISIERLYQHVRVRVQKCLKRPEHVQNPMVYGGVGNGPFFFGGQPSADAPRADDGGDGCSCCSSGVIAVVRDKVAIGAASDGAAESELELQAGAAHGIRDGDRFGLFPLEALAAGRPSGESSCDYNSATIIRAVVSAVRPLSSRLFVRGDTDTAASVRTGWLAVARTRSLLRAFPISVQWRVGRAKDSADEWREAVQEFESLDVRLPGDSDGNDGSSSIVLTRDDTLVYKIVEGSAPNVVYWESDQSSRRELLRLAQHLAWFKLVRTLTNNALADDMGHSFHNAFSIHVQTRQPGSGGVRFAPGCRLAPNAHVVCTHPECIIRVNHGDRLWLVVENREPQNGRRLYVHVFDMGSRWQVENLPAANHLVVPPRGADDVSGAVSTGKWTKSLKWSVPEELRQRGQMECEDVIKVFLTTRPTSFASLALPKLGDLIRHDRPQILADRAGGEDVSSEDWAAINFRVRTTYRQGASHSAA